MSKRKKAIERAKKNVSHMLKKLEKQARYNKSNWDLKKSQKKQKQDEARRSKFPYIDEDCKLPLNMDPSKSACANCTNYFC